MSKTHVRLLKAAKHELKDAEYICVAVKLACNDLYGVGYHMSTNAYKILHKETYDILSDINAALGDDTGYGNVMHWLQARGFYLTRDELYCYRQQWLDQMITYWRHR